MTSQISQSGQKQAPGFTRTAPERGVSDAGPLTSATLLGRLQHWEDTAAWRVFVDRYQGLLESWSRKKLTNAADVDELNQQVVWEVARRLKDFRYDAKRSFRGWLHTLHQCRLLDLLKIQKRRRLREVEIARLRRPVDASNDADPMMARMDSVGRFVRSGSIESLLSSVQSRVTSQTWSIFNDVALHGQSVADTARRHGMKYAATFAAYSRTCQMLRREAEAQGITLTGTAE